jgi:hypothetical protein
MAWRPGGGDSEPDNGHLRAVPVRLSVSSADDDIEMLSALIRHGVRKPPRGYRGALNEIVPLLRRSAEVSDSGDVVVPFPRTWQGG